MAEPAREQAVVGSARAPARGAGYLRAVFTVVWKDVAVEWRSRELLGAMLVFALLSILIFNFALELQVRLREELAAGVLWVTFAFAGTLGLNRSMALERERGCLDGLRLVPVDRSAVFFGKAAGNLLFMFLVEALLLPAYGALYNVNLAHPGLLAVVVLGSVGYAVVGTLLAAMAVQTRTRDVLLPILLFPVVLPVLISAVRASSGFLQGLPLEELTGWLNLLLVYDVVFIAIGLMVFEFVLEE